MASSVLDRFAFAQLQSLSHQPRFCVGKCFGPPKTTFFRLHSLLLGTASLRLRGGMSARACASPSTAGNGGVDWKGRSKVAMEMMVGRLQETIVALPSRAALTVKLKARPNLAIGIFSLAFTILTLVMIQTRVRKASQNHHGSVADLVKRGQLRSNRRGISKPLKYEDPFNNPLVKKDKSNSTMEVCGKVYRLAPVTLTEEQQSIHQRRRSRAYHWKRPTIFLKEGDEVPPDVDPDTVRWIPANHPFATTVSDIDENLAQTNVYQKDGVPFRIRAEHEALQKKLDALQSEQKLNKVAITLNNFRDFGMPLNSTVKPKEQDTSTVSDEHGRQIPRSDGLDDVDPFGSNEPS